MSGPVVHHADDVTWAWCGADTGVVTDDPTEVTCRPCLGDFTPPAPAQPPRRSWRNP